MQNPKENKTQVGPQVDVSKLSGSSTTEVKAYILQKLVEAERHNTVALEISVNIENFEGKIDGKTEKGFVALIAADSKEFNIRVKGRSLNIYKAIDRANEKFLSALGNVQEFMNDNPSREALLAALENGQSLIH